ncbi:SSY1 [Candida margitis]|uniref:SSY1 n=1 Tax=Candida margitis TaxID=1775924 RepID=UPI002226CE51|nr:SSY1 [Candida margitis]KAI5970453.1 SSY1 [Candida margitis]
MDSISTASVNLFPSLSNPDGNSEASSASLRRLRYAFGGPEEVDLSIPDDNSIDLSTYSTVDDVSLDSSLITEIANNHVFEDGRFKYLRAYERLAAERGAREIGNGIPLQTIELDDFEKFVKESALNDKIQGRVLAKLPRAQQKETVLDVVREQDLANDFYADSNETSEIKSRRLKSHKPDKEYALDVEDLYCPTSQNRLHRKLSVRHLQMISLGGTIGVGLFLNSGKAINIAGGFGALLAFAIVGVVVICTMMSFCEMVTFVSVIDGVSGLSSRFVDDAFGFATGWLYFLSFAFGVAGEVVAGVIMLSFFPSLKTTTSKGATTGFVFLFLGSIISSNLIDIRVFGEIEYVSSLVKLLWVVVMMIVMIVLNRGGFGGPAVGFKYWMRSKSDFENNVIFGLFRPSFNLYDNGTSPPSDGIEGDTGRFLSLLTAILVVCYAYSGTEIVCIAACEAKNPRKALPSAMRRVFWRIVIFYCLSAFLVTLNIYAGDPRLLRYLSGKTGIDESEFASNIAVQTVGGVHCSYDSSIYAGYGSGSQSPWIVALQSAGQCDFSTVANVFLVFFAVSCGNAQLYVSSRTVYALALQGKAPKFLTYCNRNGIPYNAVMFAGSFGLLAFTCVSESATVVFQNLNSVIASSGIFVWFAMCLTFIRFYYGLKRRPDIMSRNDVSYPYKSPFQPYAAIFGMCATLFMVLAMGFVVFLKHEWDTLFFFSSYGTVMVFAALYAGYRVVKGSSIASLDRLDFDSGRTEMDRYIWDGGTYYNHKSIKEVMWKWLSVLA